MAAESAREARRRKILERGSDRLAFITGQTRSLPPSAIDSLAPPPPSNRGGGGDEGGVPVADLPAKPPGDDFPTGNEFPEGRPASPTERETRSTRPSAETFLKSEEGDEAAYSVQPSSREIEPAAADGDSSRHPAATAGPGPAKGPAARVFTARRISSSISASENIRIICAASIAAMAVLSCCGRPVVSESLHGMVSYRPIWTVLLTDLALVLGLLCTSGWKERDGAGAEAAGAQEGGDWMDQMGKALEVFLILQKMAGAAFADCSLCAVIIICGFSFCSNA